MRDRYPVTMLCSLLGISRAGYYKWRRRQGTKNRYEKDRDMLTELLQEQHMKHLSYGYHRLAVEVFRETGWIFSHNLTKPDGYSRTIWLTNAASRRVSIPRLVGIIATAGREAKI